MIVCHCHGLTDSDIRAAAARTGARCTDDLRAGCPAGASCGGCRPLVDAVLRDAGPRSHDTRRVAATRRRRSA